MRHGGWGRAARRNPSRTAVLLAAAMSAVAGCVGETLDTPANTADSSLSRFDSGIPAAAPEASLPKTDATLQETEPGAVGEDCMACHGPFSEIREATQGYETSQGIAVNPHTTVDSRAEDNPHLSGEGMIECSTCHQPSPMPPASADAVPAADIEYCYSCHHRRNFSPCSSCHAANGV